MLGRLPQINVKIKVRGVWAENETGQKETKAISTAQTEGHMKDWVPVHAEQEYVIIIEISRESFGFKVKRCILSLNIFSYLFFVVVIQH